ncbi:MAG: hypothetical protein QOD45_1775 [Pseudonocardiales bacterium]|jgi:hypothetical protein|nr:hypothetical protein [Pseudonocardiales bacterium]
MEHNDINAARNAGRTKLSRKIALVGAGLAAGAIGATAIGAGAQAVSGSGSSATSGTAATAPSAPAGAPGRPNDHGSTPVRADEKAVTAADQATIKAAALKAVPGGTVYRIETDAGDGAFEAHMTKADGTEVTVKFDSNLKVIKVETGMGTGDPVPPAGTGR